jgi:tRNA dimethylallyltransferase
MSAPLIFVVGPTATGKSAVAIELAESLKAEIINADSMQFYRGMDIGTAKLPLVDRRGIPHHLIDILELSQDASVADYQAAGRAIIDDLRQRDIPVIVVGGSGLYIKALLDPLNFPGTDPAVRQRLEAEASSVGAAVMHARLARIDPAAALAILPGNARRIVRALEVIEITGEPFTATLPRAGASHYSDAIQGLIRCGSRVLSRKCGNLMQLGYARARRPAAPLAISKSCRASRGRSLLIRPRLRPKWPPANMRVVRSRGSAEMSESPGLRLRMP